MTHVLDTDHASILERVGGSDYAVLVMNLNLHPAAEVGMSVVTVQEQFRGCYARINQAATTVKLVRAYDLLFQVIDKFRRFPLIPFDARAGAVFDGLTAQKLGMSTLDRRIAAIALANNLTLATRNLSDFSKVPGLRTVDWTK